MAFTRVELRRSARITSVFRGQEDHGIETVVVHLEGDPSGWGQGFGCLCMKDEEESRRFVREVCETFGHSDPERLKGQKCLALYTDSPWGTIEGIEAPGGKRFTIRGWRRRYYPDHAPTPTQAKRASIESDIRFHERRLAERRAELATLGELVDWDAETTAPTVGLGSKPLRPREG
jgi:hypothetical protein